MTITIEKKWNNGVITFPSGTLFRLSRLQTEGCIWDCITPNGHKGQSFLKPDIVPGKINNV